MYNRRTFLTAAATTAAGLLVPEWVLDPLKGRSMVTVLGLAPTYHEISFLHPAHGLVVTIPVSSELLADIRSANLLSELVHQQFADMLRGHTDEMILGSR